MPERNTKSKEMILDALRTNHLLTLKEISEKLPEVDFSTIYRNIKKFMKTGLVNEVSIVSGEKKYELNEHAHDHFVCDNCQTVKSVVFSEKDLKKILPSGYSLTIGQNVIRGFCNKCN